VHVVYLNTPENVCTQRRNIRGHTFHKAFVKGAQTRAQHTALQFIRDPQWFLDGTLPVETMATQLKTHSFFVQLQTECSLPNVL
jgi:cobyrinic acid a,c-diamide synthase